MKYVINLKIKQKKIKKAYLNFIKKRTKISESIHSTSFLYSSFKKIYPDFCPLYRANKICHKVNKSQFDCWNCYCNYYDYEYIDEASGLVGRCKRLRNKGKYTNGIWDCSDCSDIHEY